MTNPGEFRVIVGYGTDMGNAEDAAMSFAEALEPATGIKVEAIELNQIEPSDLQSATHFIAVVSTFGEGEFTDNAALFWEAISADGAARLEHLTFAILALGDSSYEFFCNAGRLLDERLEQLGANRLTDRVDIDGPYLQPSTAWITDVVKLLCTTHAGDAFSTEVPTVAVPTSGMSRDRHEPVEATLVVNRLLTSPQSDKEVRHYEIDLAGTGISYETGDSIAVHATNDPSLVAHLLSRLGVDASHTVAGYDEPLGLLLREQLEIRTPSRELRALVASRTSDRKVADALTIDPVPGSWLYGRDVADLIGFADLNVDEVVDTLRPLAFRDYSIASSPLLHPDRIHLTVATVRYGSGDRLHGGVASTFLAERSQTIRVHLRPNHAFRLPAPDVPVVMIGPGTGIAPFRGFLQERQATQAHGRSWLFFGDRRRSTDFLYGDDLNAYLASGVLTRLDLAFSRDGGPDEPKQYVQQRMWENRTELYDWLQQGAHIYVCGDADRMAKDVDAMLHMVIEDAGAMDADAAHRYVNELIKTHRYLRDIY